MSNRVESFPVLNENSINELEVNLSNLRAEYVFNNVVTKLDIIQDEEKNNEFILDNNGMWSSEKNNLRIYGRLGINNYRILFEEYKVASKTTELGIALTYISKNSSKTYTKPIGSILYTDYGKKEMDFSLNFDEGELATFFSLKFLIYVKNVNSNDLINAVFAKNDGTILGDIYECNLIVEGNGSEFPISIIEKPNLPLWDMEVNFETLGDLFSKEMICLKINKAHKDFFKLGVDKISQNNELIWKEILASFFSNLLYISNEIENLEEIFNEEPQDGTVGKFLKFQLIQFNIIPRELKNVVTLSSKIRKELDKLL